MAVGLFNWGRVMTKARTKETTSHAKSGYELWQETIDGAMSDARWHGYDCDIQRTVNQFNKHLSRTAGYRSLDWRLIKAMVWTESGGPNSRAWRDNPIQIGNPGDPGLSALFSGREEGELIIPPELRNRLTIGTVKMSPQMNISAGIAYLLMRHASYGFATVQDEQDNTTYDVLVKAGDTLEKIAKLNGTTVDTIRKCSTGALVLRPGQSLRYQKASIQKVITRWASANTTSIARLYNVGDPAYAKKLTYCLSIMQKASQLETSCA
jgi:hypothetical protein